MRLLTPLDLLRIIAVACVLFQFAPPVLGADKPAAYACVKCSACADGQCRCLGGGYHCGDDGQCPVEAKSVTAATRGAIPPGYGRLADGKLFVIPPGLPGYFADADIARLSDPLDLPAGFTVPRQMPAKADGVKVLLFTAPSRCAPCVRFAPTWGAWRAKYPALTFQTVECDANPDLVRAYGVAGIPCVVVERAGKVAGTLRGAELTEANLTGLLK